MVVLESVNSDMYNFAKQELNKLENGVLDSMGHFNRKYYMAGFSDALEIILKQDVEKYIYL